MTVVFGASGHAKEIAFIIRSAGGKVDYFVDKETGNKLLNDTKIVSEKDFYLLAKGFNELIDVFIGIGSSYVRKSILEKLDSLDLKLRFPNLFHNSVIMDTQHKAIEIGQGNIFFPGVILTTNIAIGNHNHFNSNSSVSHDCKIGDFNTFSPGVKIAGNAVIDNYNFFGINSSVVDGVVLKSNLLIGAGSAVIGNISEPGTYVGLPAKKIK
jgi:sugar O-acyltransferase (sialic acid O-acetyltransferase NeuD family)